MLMKLFHVLNEGPWLSRVCFITVLTCGCVKSFESINVIKNYTNKFDWTRVGIHHKTACRNTQKITRDIEQPDSTYKGGSFLQSRQQIIIK